MEDRQSLTRDGQTRPTALASDTNNTQILPSTCGNLLLDRNEGTTHTRTLCSMETTVAAGWRSADCKSQRAACLLRGRAHVRLVQGRRHLHAAVRHGHGIVRHGVAGDLAVVGTGGGCKNVARVDKVRAGGVSAALGPAGKQARLMLRQLHDNNLSDGGMSEAKGAEGGFMPLPVCCCTFSLFNL